MTFKKLLIVLTISITILLLCYAKLVLYQNKTKDNRLHVVCTTNIIADAIHYIAKDTIKLDVLMGPGVDPHLYKPIEQDVTKIAGADIIFYNGLHLEACMADLFEKMSTYKTTIAISKDMPQHLLLSCKEHEHFFDPHVWFDPLLWCYALETITTSLQKYNPEKSEFYEKNKKEYIQQILTMYAKTKESFLKIPTNIRVLITGHDAFEYFGRAYVCQVFGIQGINTTSESCTKDIQDLAHFIFQHKIPAIFLETSIPSRNVLAVKQNLEHKGFFIKIGQELYSDSLGSLNSQQGTYIGMMEYNIQTIIHNLT